MSTMELPTRARITGGYYIDAVAAAYAGYTDWRPGTRKEAKRKANRIMRRQVRVDLRRGEW